MANLMASTTPEETIIIPQDKLTDRDEIINITGSGPFSKDERSFIETIREIIMLPYNNPKRAQLQQGQVVYKSTERLVLIMLVLASMKQGGGAVTSFSNSDLASILGMSRPTVIQALENLKALGLINPMRNMNSAAVYEINFEAINSRYLRKTPVKKYSSRLVELKFRVPVEEEMDKAIIDMSKQFSKSYSDTVRAIVQCGLTRMLNDMTMTLSGKETSDSDNEESDS